MMQQLQIDVKRWYVYQRERFPLLVYMPLVITYTAAMVNGAATLRGVSPPALPVQLGAMLSCLLFFLLLRLADEWKDYHHDIQSRPYLPVARGVVSLRELGVLAIGCLLAQVALAWWAAPPLLWLLLPVWGYFAAMTVEFGIGQWLHKHVHWYLLSHMVLLPLFGYYLTAWDWLVYAASPPPALGWLVLLSFVCGLILEIGRKLRAPECEEPGVATYSAAWGARRAALLWLCLLGVAGGIAAVWLVVQGGNLGGAGLLLAMLILAAAVVWNYVRQPVQRYARWFQPLSGLWILLTYGAIALVPWLSYGA